MLKSRHVKKEYQIFDQVSSFFDRSKFSIVHLKYNNASLICKNSNIYLFMFDEITNTTNMKIRVKLLFTLSLIQSICFAQQAKDIINQIKIRQTELVKVSYDLKRIDTIGTHIRQMKGSVFMERHKADTVFGFKFWASKVDDPIDKIYDGYIGYSVNTKEKSYEMTTSKIGFSNLTNGGGGHLIMGDLIKLDTSGASNIEISEDIIGYDLIFKYPDLEKYDVTKRFKQVKIDKKTMLPVSVRQHQESLGRIQDLYFEVTRLDINPTSSIYNFSELDFLKSYKHEIPVVRNSPITKFVGQPFPNFTFPVFANGTKQVSLTKLKGKVVLLDFWEVWCSPCIESMPKVEDLYQKYKDSGLLVYGIINDKSNLDSSKSLVKKRNINIPMLLANEEFKRSLQINSVPLYILLDKAGKVSYFSHGFSDGIETAIKSALEVE
ncbi:MAG: TlpA family protein disulfide reductase [Pedobacter sp.]|nr:MAG: TlpA family protein disulfide reductase [Pedobacter sp.]